MFLCGINKENLTEFPLDLATTYTKYTWSVHYLTLTYYNKPEPFIVMLYSTCKSK